MAEPFKIYVGTYGKYNSGSIMGQWIDLSGLDKEGFYAKCKDLHRDEHDPEYMFQDYDSIPSKLIGESWVSDILFDIIDLISHEDLKDDQLEAFMDFIESDLYYPPQEKDIDEIFEHFEVCYLGEYESIEEYTDQMFDDLHLHEIPNHLVYYIDYKAYYHEMKHDYYLSGNGHLFHLR